LKAWYMDSAAQAQALQAQQQSSPNAQQVQPTAPSPVQEINQRRQQTLASNTAPQLKTSIPVPVKAKSDGEMSAEYEQKLFEANVRAALEGRPPVTSV